MNPNTSTKTTEQQQEAIRAEKQVAIEEYRTRETQLHDGYQRNLQDIQRRFERNEITFKEQQHAYGQAVIAFEEARTALYKDCMAVFEAIKQEILQGQHDECAHMHSEQVSAWEESDGTDDLHMVYEFECKTCGKRWLETW
jgi:hypothetical protein